MRQAKTELYFHLVWATAERMALLKAPLRRPLQRCLEDQAQHLGCTVLAVGGMPDHVHMVLRVPAKLAVAKVAQQLKGVSSQFMANEIGGGELFRWQAGYGAFSLSRSHVSRVVAYVEGQEQHHAGGKLWPEWEETDEAAERP